MFFLCQYIVELNSPILPSFLYSHPAIHSSVYLVSVCIVHLETYYTHSSAYWHLIENHAYESINLNNVLHSWKRVRFDSWLLITKKFITTCWMNEWMNCVYRQPWVFLSSLHWCKSCNQFSFVYIVAKSLYIHVKDWTKDTFTAHSLLIPFCASFIPKRANTVNIDLPNLWVFSINGDYFLEPGLYQSCLTLHQLNNNKIWV